MRRSQFIPESTVQNGQQQGIELGIGADLLPLHRICLDAKLIEPDVLPKRRHWDWDSKEIFGTQRPVPIRTSRGRLAHVM
ncbi:MAG: hypothetical protein J0L64_16740 [Acidobacteria bacterium]|nr:hypothetical protein [Acidobacteriota bacterium]